MVNLLNTTLDATQPLKVCDPNDNSEEEYYWELDKLTNDTKNTRDILATAIKKRFWDTYVKDSPKRSYLYDLALTMCPRTGCDLKLRENLLNNYTPINTAINKITYQKLNDTTWRIIRGWAILIAWGQGVGEDDEFYNITVNNISDNQPKKKRKKTYSNVLSTHSHDNNNDNPISNNNDMNYHDANHHDDGEVKMKTRLDIIVNTVESEIKKLKAILAKPNDYNILADIIIEKPLDWYKDNKKTFPILSIVARLIYGHTISSAAVEVGFGLGGMVYSSKRNQLKAGMFDILASLYVNKLKLPDARFVKKLTWMEANAAMVKVYRGSAETMPLLAGEVMEGNGSHMVSDDTIDEQFPLSWDIDI